MRKQKVLLLAAICALALAGCKKKETIDLSSLHTTAEVEKETLPETTEAASTESQENSASESKESGSQYSVHSKIETHTDKNVTVEYPVLSNMKDGEIQKQANELLKQNALAVQTAFPLSEGQSLSVKATVESINLRRVTVTYRGELKDSGGSNPSRIFYTSAVDLETAKNLRLSNYTDAYTAAGYIEHGDYKLAETNADEQAIRSYINASGKDVQYYYKKLADSDFSGDTGSSWPGYFSYEKDGTIYMSLPLTHELGDYALIRYSPDNK